MWFGKSLFACPDALSCEMPMLIIVYSKMVRDREAWHAAVHGVAKSRT